MEEYRTGTNQLVYVHTKDKCAGDFCVIHNPSDHNMIGMKTHWRNDRGIMERICPCGVGHPDPDEIDPNTVHGCCGMCLGKKCNDNR
jgi:hypothetical protein